MAETATTGQSNENGKPKESLKVKTSSQSDTNNGSSTPVKEMRSVVLQNFGGLKWLKAVKKPEPSVGENEVLIRVKACGLNFPDLLMRQGTLDCLSKPPFILGSECAGVVEAIGEGVESVKVGDRVAALPDSKAYAELVVVSSKFVYQLPEGMSFQDAVAMTMNFTVAYYLLFELSNLQAGQTVLIHSVGGGVGQALTQLAKTVSNVTLIGIASKHKHDNLKDNVTHLLDHSTDYVQEVKKLFPNGVDLVLDCLCGEDANKGYSLLKPMGRYVLYGTASYVSGETKSILSLAKSWWQLDKISPMRLYDDNKTISGFNLRHLLYKQNGHEYVRNVIEKVYQLYSQKVIHPVVDSTLALEDVAEGMQKLHDRKNVGKVILDLSLEPKPKPVEEEPSAKSGKRKNNVKDKTAENKENVKGDKKADNEAPTAQNGESEPTEEVKKEGEGEGEGGTA